MIHSLEPALLHLHFPRGGSFGDLFEASLDCSTGRTRIIVWQRGPRLGSLSKDVTAVLPEGNEEEPRGGCVVSVSQKAKTKERTAKA